MRKPGTIRRTTPGQRRNDLCFCKSGKKFKRCCGATKQQRETRAAAVRRHYESYDWNQVGGKSNE